MWRFPHAQLDEYSIRQLTRQVLFLSVFSGPVEGILMIIAIYVVTGFYGALSHPPSALTARARCQ